MWCSRSLHRLPATLAAAVVLTLAAPAWSAPEPDERTVQAQELVDQGQKLAETDPKRALAAFRASYEIRPDYRVLYSIGKACLRTGDQGCAASSYDGYLREGGAEIPAARRKEVEAVLKSLTKNLGWVVVKANAAGAYVKLDGVVVGRTPLAQPLAVSPGAHKIVVVSGGNVVEKSVQVDKGATETLDVEVKKDEAAPAAAPPAPLDAEPSPAAEPAPAPPPPAPAKKRAFPVVPWLVTGALAVGTGVSALLALEAESDYDALRRRFPISRGELDDAHSSGRNLLVLTAALGGATAIALAVSGIATVARSKDRAPDRTVGFLVGPTGVAVVGKLP